VRQSQSDEVSVGSAQIVAVDLGGTSVRAGLVETRGNLVDFVKEPSEKGAEPEQIVRLMARMVQCGRPTTAIVGVPGRVDRVAGRVLRARNLHHTDLSELSASFLSERIGLPVELAGDAELAAVGESYFGAGSTTGSTAYLTFSTGVGAAAVVDGLVLSGRAVGFQIGFLRTLGPDRPLADVLASGQRLDALSKIIGRKVDFQDALGLANGAGRLASEAREALHDIRAAAVSVALLMCHVSTADILVVGGGLTAASGGSLVAEIDRRIKDQDFSGVSWDVSVRPAARGDEAGLLGAAAWSRARPSRADTSAPPLSARAQA
jgi:glucokinase